MKPHKEKRETAQGGVVAGANFGISRGDEAHIMGILRDQLYSNKVLAVLREYGANAWDAHRMVGKGHLPIQIHVPDLDGDLELRIRDFGPGLTRQEVFEVFTQYGASTKRLDNEAVGMLGIGSKSAFAYADSFAVTSWKDGTKSIYVCALDESERGVCNLVHEEPYDDQALTGVEIAVATRVEDVGEWRSEAEGLYQHFDPRPEINVDLPVIPEARQLLPSGTIDYVTTDSDNYRAGKWFALMGPVAYEVNLDNLPLTEEHKCLRKLSGLLRFNIGDLQVSASREALAYKDKTKAAVVAKFESLVDEYVARTLDELSSAQVPDYEKRLRALTVRAMDIELPEDWEEDWAKAWVKIHEADTARFSILHAESTTNQITIDRTTCVYVDDVGRTKKLKGYYLGSRDYVIRPLAGLKTNPTVAELEAIVAEVFAACRLTGIKVERLSTKPWRSTSRNGWRDNAHRAKHKASMFRLIRGRTHYSKPFSANWEVVERVPEPTDVYVVLEEFEAPSVQRCYHDDKRVAEAVGIPLPEVYGYKTTTKKPVDRSKLAGTEYSEWRVAYLKSLMTPERATAIQHLLDLTNGTYADDTSRRRLCKALGKDHPIYRHLRRAVDTRKALVGHSQEALRTIARACGLSETDCEASRELAELKRTYPLLGAYGIGELWNTYHDHRAEWIEYVKTVDIARGATYCTQDQGEEDAADSVHAN